MKTTHRKFWAIAVVLVLFSFTACRKEIVVPTPELEKLFGTWDWVSSSGGFGGDTYSPATAGFSKKIAFGKNGVCKTYKNGAEEEKMKFTLLMGESIYSVDKMPLIRYKGKLFDTQSVHFQGQDTLLLGEECSDCYMHIYTRQK